MLKCENCFYHKICKKFAVIVGAPEEMIEAVLKKDQAVPCKDYKDKSLIAELPCRVGDTVYILISESTKFGGPYIKEEKVTEISTAGRIWTDSCYYDSDDSDRTIFLTRDEAERVLKEQKKNA